MTVLSTLLEGKSEKDREAVLQWAKGTPMIAVAKALGVSRGRLTIRLGLPAIGTVEYYQARFDAAAPHLTVLTIGNKEKQVVLRVRDSRTQREFEHISWWMFEQIKEDPYYIFFPTEEERLARMAAKGTLALIDGMPVRQYAEKVGAAYATVLKKIAEVGEDAAVAQLKDFSRQESTLEALVCSWLKGLPIIKNRQFPGTRYLPDIRLEEQKIVIECDGLFYHSETYHDSKYHQKKRAAYAAGGYRSFFFREDELLKKPHICKAILANAIHTNQRVYARATNVAEGDDSFFEQHHLMGKGKGRVWTLQRQGKVVAAMQVKYRSKTTETLEISRFCSAPGTSVVGGFSKLVSHVVKEYQPKTITTFIDLRYGDGSYLKKLGWEKVSESVSFAWTDGRGNTFHRMRFPGLTGYEKGMLRVWDCGQARWELSISSQSKP